MHEIWIKSIEKISKLLCVKETDGWADRRMKWQMTNTVGFLPTLVGSTLNDTIYSKWLQALWEKGKKNVAWLPIILYSLEFLWHFVLIDKLYFITPE